MAATKNDPELRGRTTRGLPGLPRVKALSYSVNKGLLVCLLALRSHIGAQPQRVVCRLKTVSTLGTKNMNYSPFASTHPQAVCGCCADGLGSALRTR